MSENKVEMKNDVEIVNMRYLADKNFSLATVKYGDVYLQNIKVSEHHGEAVVQYPATKGKDEKYYPIYKLSSEQLFCHDKVIIEAALIKNHYGLRSGDIEKVSHTPIPEVKAQSHNPKVINEHQFPDGGIAMTVTYKNLMINSVQIREDQQGNRFVSMPSYKKADNTWGNYIVSPKSFNESIIAAYDQKQGNEAKQNFDMAAQAQMNDFER